MQEFLSNHFDSTISIIAILVSFAAVLYSRRNMKTIKYIETITVQRIKWIDSLRHDLSNVISGIHMLGFCISQLKEFDEFTDNVGFENSEDAEKGYKYRDELELLKKKLDTELNKIDLIKIIDLSILKLNKKDDHKIISLLEKAKHYILISDYESCLKNNFLDNLRDEITIVLKNEWEKVKLEVQRGKLVNEPSKKKFWI